MAMLESRKRSIAKSVMFRVIVVASDMVLVYLLTRRVDAAVGIVVLTNLSSTTLYYLHERLWDRIAWGRKASTANGAVPPV
jgi:uncharacterized membrane protein